MSTLERQVKIAGAKWRLENEILTYQSLTRKEVAPNQVRKLVTLLLQAEDSRDELEALGHVEEMLKGEEGKDLRDYLSAEQTRQYLTQSPRSLQSI